MPKRALIVFHVLLAVALALLLWGFSAPGLDLIVLGVAGWLFPGLFILWIKLVFDVRSWWLAIAPVVVILAGVAALLGGPRQARWEASAGAFADYVADLPTPVRGEIPDWKGFTEGTLIGTYRVSSASAVYGGYLFYSGGGFDDTGFLYAPGGPEAANENGGFEGPRYRELGDGWYSFIASW